MRANRRTPVVVLTASLLTACSTSNGQPTASPASGAGEASGPPTASASAPSPAPAPNGAPSPPSRSPGTGQEGSGTATSPALPVNPSPVAEPTAFVPLDQVIRDPDLGHEITVLRLARDLPWPPAQAQEASSLELVGVEMTWTPGTTYTATLRTVDFSLGTSNAYPNRPDAILNPSLQAAGWSLLPAELATGQSGTGWVVFRVEPAGAPALRLDYTRPPSRVTDNGQVFPKTVFSTQLVG